LKEGGPEFGTPTTRRTPDDPARTHTSFLPSILPIAIIYQKLLKMPSTRWCVVSDIDDTMLNTSIGCLPKLSALINTFLKHPQSVNGMPDFYNYIQVNLLHPRFWYISASPYSIMPCFRSPFSLKDYPSGEIIVPTWKKAVQILLMGSVFQYKVECIDRLYAHCSSHKLICLGDTLMKDPEVYGEIYRRYPDQVILIFIRIVGRKGSYRNSMERFAKAFAMVPGNIYHIFTEPCELNVRLNDFAWQEKDEFWNRSIRKFPLTTHC
jgi:hypothetical protein